MFSRAGTPLVHILCIGKAGIIVTFMRTSTESIPTTRHNVVRLAILQRICPSYRVSLFRELSIADGLEATLFIGDDIPNSKVKSARVLTGIKHKRIKTRIIKLGSRIFPLHTGLIQELRRFKPDVILCEGESHFLGYLQAILYRTLYDKDVGLIHWCFISLPGESERKNLLTFYVKKYFRRYFDAFLLYSSYSKKRLIEQGQTGHNAFVATNVGDTNRYLALATDMIDSPNEAKTKLNLPDRFTVLYSGTLDENKRPQMLLELANLLNKEDFNFVVLGSGPLLNDLRKRASLENLHNVFIPGHVVEELTLYYRAADVLLVPGRGGIVISEAMSFGLPAIVYQADGSEYDLIRNGVTGFILPDLTIQNCSDLLLNLSRCPGRCKRMGLMAKELIMNQFNTENMVYQISCAVKYVNNLKKAQKEKEPFLKRNAE
jgi:glycosyltransferase involved in cell wall biosynthesis